MITILIKIDFESEVPIYFQLRNEIIKAIARGELLENTSLPSVRTLANELDINMHTVNKAYNILKEEGYVKIDRRKGALISYAFKNFNEEFKNTLDEELEIFIAQSVARGIEKDLVINKINNIFAKYMKE